MKAETFLLTLALLGGGIAGFSGLIVALPRQASTDAWKLNEVAGIQLLLEYSFGLIFLSLVPFVINEITAIEVTTWNIATYVASIFIIFETCLQFYRLYEAYRIDSPPRSPLLLVLIIAPGILLLAARWFIGFDFVAWYEIVLLWIVGAIGVQFWFFIKAHTGHP